MKALVIGYGSVGKRHINNLTTFPGIEIIVCTNRTSDEFLQEKGCIIFSSLEKCIREKPDIALIANVTSLHVKTAIKLADAGIHMFIEKPLGNSLKDVRRLCKSVKKHKVITLIGCNMRFHPCIKKIKEIISRNEIGRIISVQVENGSYLPNWHPYEDYRLSYASRKELGGGVVLTNIHEIDYLYWFFGGIKEIFSITGKFSNLELTVEDLSEVLLRFKNRVIAEVHLDYFQNPAFRRCKVIGTNGIAYWDSDINTVKLYNTKKRRWVEKLKLQNYDSNTMYVEEMKYFLKCVKEKKETFNNAFDGANILKIALVVKKSSKNKKMIKINDKNDFY